ncbi:hypothetical protein [Streptomyces sp. I05A-00742]|uniref:hypothetical protein n=1 Tax=Streptomyces sp. I05A-00742 TaxID=2732853 RepID=UPI00148922BA|nr:hypothetical protein [Streptomyces sp. I05A-00742]
MLTGRYEGAGAVTEVYRIRIRSGAVQESAAHIRGVEEQIIVLGGTARVGEVSASFLVGPGGTARGPLTSRTCTPRRKGTSRPC